MTIQIINNVLINNKKNKKSNYSPKTVTLKSIFFVYFIKVIEIYCSIVII